MERLLVWLDDQIMIAKEAKEKVSASNRFFTILEYNHKNLLLVKEYITDYEKLVNDYRDVVSENKLLKVEKMALEGRNIYEDMRMKYRANRRKWGQRLSADWRSICLIIKNIIT